MGWAPNHLVLGAQLAPGKKRLFCIPGTPMQGLKRVTLTMSLRTILRYAEAGSAPRYREDCATRPDTEYSVEGEGVALSR